MLDDLMKMLDVQFNPDTYRVKGKKDEHTKTDTSSDSEGLGDIENRKLRHDYS